MGDAERDYLTALPMAAEKTTFARSQFDQLEKCKLRKVMYQEQRSICIYCEQKIEEVHPEPRIDHWRPLSREPEFALHWKNLYLSCSTHGTCDDSKGSTPLKWNDLDPNLPWPFEFCYENVLGFTSGGEIYVRKDVDIDIRIRRALELAIADQQDGPRERQAILNLNSPSLVAARSAAIESEKTKLERDFHGRTATRSDRAQRAKELLQKNPFPQFVSIRIAWLIKKLGEGR